MGTLSMVEACRFHIEQKSIDDFRFLHVSTDEVFGDLGPADPPFSQESSYQPSSPYSASKAASDFIVKSWHRTFGFPGIVTNCSNNFGPGQNKEKLIPTIINSLMAGRKIPIYGDGLNIRDWLPVDTHVAYLEAIMVGGKPGDSYLIGGDMELTNLELYKHIHEAVSTSNVLNKQKISLTSLNSLLTGKGTTIDTLSKPVLCGNPIHGCGSYSI